MAWKQMLDENFIGAANVAASLDGSGLIPDGQIPSLAISKITGLQTSLDGKVPTTRTVNLKPLSADITLSKGDVGLGNVENKTVAQIFAELTAADIPELEQSKISGLTAALAAKVPTTRTVNLKPLSADITLDKGDVGVDKVENKAVA